MNTEQHLLKFKSYIENFSKLNEDGWDYIKQHLRVKSLSKGQLLNDFDDVVTQIHFISEGCICQKYRIDDQEKIIGFLLENDIDLNPRNLLINAPAFIKNECFEDSTIVYFDKAKLLSEFNNNKDIKTIIQTIGMQTISQFDWLLEYLLSTSPEKRYKLLMSYNPKLLQKVPQYAIAEMLDISPVSLSRIRARISKKK